MNKTMTGILTASATLLAAPLVLQGGIIFSQASDNMYVINNGSFNQATGAFTRTAADTGIDVGQGVAVSFNQFNLETVGHSVQAQFTLSGIGENNSGFQIALGLFSGAAVTQNAHTAVTDAWTGYFQSIGTRNSSGDVNGGVYRQGAGSDPLMARTLGWGNAAGTVDGAYGRITSGVRPALNQTVSQTVTMTLTRISDTQLQLSTVYTTARADGTATRTTDGIPNTWSAASGVGTLVSTYNISDGPTTISGFTFGTTTSNFTVQDLQVTAIPEPGTLVLVGIALGSLLLLRRRK
ncbi:MAG: PEP-CTERM sorting domain-containing protein [Verrucomicrobia bacterium]|nr:PEP-CTERM sorting domain-containing protein [Verrucomicrobiota bacterium]MCH8526022.1 PEP-CTERM sorting domain-containing protein [Kiritimatiellia bacterium]